MVLSKLLSNENTNYDDDASLMQSSHKNYQEIFLDKNSIHAIEYALVNFDG